MPWFLRRLPTSDEGEPVPVSILMVSSLIFYLMGCDVVAFIMAFDKELKLAYVLHTIEIPVILSTFSEQWQRTPSPHTTTPKWRRIDWCFMWCALSHVSACLDPACIFSFSCWALHYKTEKYPRLFTGQACLLKYTISKSFPAICELFACSTLRWDHVYRLQIEGSWPVPY